MMSESLTPAKIQSHEPDFLVLEIAIVHVTVKEIL